MTNKLVTIDNQQFTIITYKGQRVVTTEMLAQGYGTTAKSINNNFSRNQERFVEGTHYFRLEGKDVEILRTSFRGLQISNKVRSVTLWTERGAARHAKITETDQAWNFQEKLEDSYFRQADTLTDLLDNPGKLRELLSGYSEKVELLEETNSQLTIHVDSLQKHFSQGITLPAFAKALNGVNSNKISWWAHERGWLYNEQRDKEKEPRWRVASYARDRYMTEETTEVKPHGADPFQRKTPVMLNKGCHRMYELYLKGQLPMKITWNGIFSHDKAVYTPEDK